jgi:hypothetical protein
MWCKQFITHIILAAAEGLWQLGSLFYHDTQYSQLGWYISNLLLCDIPRNTTQSRGPRHICALSLAARRTHCNFATWSPRTSEPLKSFDTPVLNKSFIFGSYVILVERFGHTLSKFRPVFKMDKTYLTYPRHMHPGEICQVTDMASFL